jgi:hypothetical protein
MWIQDGDISDPGSGWKKVRSGINIPDLQHLICVWKMIFLRQYVCNQCCGSVMFIITDYNFSP